METFKKYFKEGWNKEEGELYSETVHFIQKHFPLEFTEEEIKEYFKEIKNKNQRTNTLDKQWVACDKIQEYEKETVVNAIWEIVRYKIDAITGTINQNLIYEKTLEICNEMNKKGITHKPRTSFYILVLRSLEVER